MRKMRSAVIGSLFVVVCVGCGTRLSQESEFEVPLEGKMFLVEPVGSEQKIKVSADAEGAPVNVFIYLQKPRSPRKGTFLPVAPRTFWLMNSRRRRSSWRRRSRPRKRRWCAWIERRPRERR